MKQSKSFLAGILFFLAGAAVAIAAPVAEPAAAAPEAVQASVALPAETAAPAADCAAASPFAADVVTSASLDYVCGVCSQSPCSGAAVNSICGFASGKYKRCQDYLGTTCPADGNARCRCSSDPIP